MKLIVKVGVVFIEKYLVLNIFVKREERKWSVSSWERENWRVKILKRRDD